jgi:hypothetical protein
LRENDRIVRAGGEEFLSISMRNRSLLQAFAHFLSLEVRRIALLNEALEEMRKALDRLGKEIVILLAILLCLWHLLWDLLMRLLSPVSR